MSDDVLRRDPLGAHRRPRQGPRGARGQLGGLRRGRAARPGAPRGARRRGSRPGRGRRAACARSAAARSTCRSARRWPAACSPSPAAARRSSRRRSSRRSLAGELLVAPALNEPGRGPARAARRRGSTATGSPAARSPCPRSTTSPAHDAAARLRHRRRRRAGRRTRRPAGATASPARPRRRSRGASRGDLRASTARRCSACSPTARPTCCASTPSPGCCSSGDGLRRRGPRPDRRLHQGADASSVARSPSSRPSRSRSPTSTSPPGWSRWPPTRSPAASAPAQPAADDLAVAAYWFCDRAPSALQTCHHLHGGMGVDETYPLHRYFARVKDVARLLGGRRGDARRRPGAASPTGQERRAHRRAARVQGRGPQLLLRPGHRRGPDRDADRPARRGLPPDHQADGRRTAGWASAGRWSTAARGSAASSSRSSPTRPRGPTSTCPSVTLQTVGPTLQAFGTEKQKDMFLGRHPGRRRALRDRLLRARRRHRPGVAAHARRQAGRRPLRRQRPEDVDHRRPRRRLRLAGRAHRPRRPQAQGHLGADRGHQGPGLLLDADRHLRRLAPRRTRRTTTTCGCRSTCSSARRTRAGG